MTKGEQQFNQWFDEYANGIKVFEEADMKQAYLQGRADLVKENAELQDKLKNLASVAEVRLVNWQKLEKENAELKKVAEFQQSSNMSRHFENKKLKEGLAVGSILNKGLNSLNKALEEERDKYRNMVFDKDEQLTKAKELLKKFMKFYEKTARECYSKDFQKTLADTEQFLKECK